MRRHGLLRVRRSIYGPGARLPYEVRVRNRQRSPRAARAGGARGAVLPDGARRAASRGLRAVLGEQRARHLRPFRADPLDPRRRQHRGDQLPATGRLHRSAALGPPFEAIVTLAPTPGNAGHALLGGTAEFSATPPWWVASAPSSHLSTATRSPPLRSEPKGGGQWRHLYRALGHRPGRRLRDAHPGGGRWEGDPGDPQRQRKDRFGNTVVLQVAGVGAVRYAHLQSYSVRAGDHVLAGQRIGLTDNTGLSTGPHLHFELAPDAASPATRARSTRLPDRSQAPRLVARRAIGAPRPVGGPGQLHLHDDVEGHRHLPRDGHLGR